jgi:hypothetical protein
MIAFIAICSSNKWESKEVRLMGWLNKWPSPLIENFEKINQIQK